MPSVPCLNSSLSELRKSRSSSRPTTRTASRQQPPMCHALHEVRPGALARARGPCPRGHRDTRRLAHCHPVMRTLPLGYQRWTAREMIAQFLRMSFVCAFLALLRCSWWPAGEETKTSPCWQCDHTERASFWRDWWPFSQRLAAISGVGASTTTELLWERLRCRLWASCGCDAPWDPSIRFVG